MYFRHAKRSFYQFLTPRSLKLGLPDYQKFLEELAKAKKVEVADIVDKLKSCGPPGTTGTTVRKDIPIITNNTNLTTFIDSQSAVKTAAVDRLTDSAKYTGSHVSIAQVQLIHFNAYVLCLLQRMRFDESGKGRGIEGRKDVPDGSGYVQGYANRDSYDKSH